MKKKIKKTMLGIFAAGNGIIYWNSYGFCRKPQGWRTPQKYRK